MNTPSPIEQLNVRYIHALIARWECILDRCILARHGQHGGLSDGVDDDALREAQEVHEAECQSLREQAADAELSLSLDRMALTYGLSEVEFQLLQMALLPVLDLSFRQRLARYNNNILQDFLDVALALELLLPSRLERLAARAYFDDEAPLIRHRLITLKSPAEARGTGLNAMELIPSERLADQILCRPRLDASLKEVAALEVSRVSLDEVVADSSAIEALVQLTARFTSGHGQGAEHWEPEPFWDQQRLIIQFTGSPGSGSIDLAYGLANRLGRRLLMVNTAALNQRFEHNRELVSMLFAEARSQGLLMVLMGCDTTLSAAGRLESPVAMELGGDELLIILLSSTGASLSPAIEAQVMWQVDLDRPDAASRETLWRRYQPQGVEVDGALEWSDLANRYELHGGQIQNAWAAATRLASNKKSGQVVDLEMLSRSAHAQIRANMADYSVKSSVNLSLDALVLPEETQVLVNEALSACQNRVFVMSRWGFGKRLVTGKGICMLFKGEPGTGKTFCAEILASELGMKLYQVSIPKIVSKYVGETEKNLSKIFHSARASHSMLLFDEADALFTKRVSVEHAIDRFSNMETNLLLQEIERFEGVTILTTNLDKNFDDAFARRIQFKIDFPFPDAEHRAKIWSLLFPPDCPLEEGVDFADLGERFELSGGHIKNAVLRAAYRAASRGAGSGITNADIDFAAQQECKNAGKLFRSNEGAEDW